MISKQFNMSDAKKKPEPTFRWEHKWLDNHSQWMWVKVYCPIVTAMTKREVRSTAKHQRAGKTSVLKGVH